MQKFDVIIIGTGILGLATAYQLLKQRPGLKLGMIEKENGVAKHQTGHNSGVIHSGIYYRPGSLKAKNCIQGVKDLTQFCESKNIPYQQCGKLIVASEESELSRLEELERRGRANGVEGLRMVSPNEIKEIEPYAAGIKGLYSPKTSIIDFVQVAHEYANEVKHLGGILYFNQELKKIEANREESILVTLQKEFCTRFLINCAGVQADRIGHMHDPSIRSNQILPFRGEYYKLTDEKSRLVRGLIYPVPDPKFPFLGVHLSKTMDGSVEAGPNAVLALSRNGYYAADVNFKDCWGYVTYPGFWKMATRYWKIGLYEMYRSFSKKVFLKSLQRLVPSLQEKDLVTGFSGVRSQIVKPDGTMEDDFSLIANAKAIHILNAPSPAATASLAIGKQIAGLALQNFWGERG